MWGKRALLRGWCVDKGKIGDCYRKMLTTVRVVAKQGVEEKWITKAEALQKWGAEELKDRLQKGTIKARRNPLDRDYWEFQAIVEKKSNMAEKDRETQYGSAWQKA